MRSETIQVTGVSKSYSKKQILNQIDFSTQSGQIYGMIGPSGSGKTTFIKMLVGMEKPDAGHVHVLNTAMPNLTILQQIGYMAQSDALYPTLTGKENLQFFAAIFKLSKSEQKERIAYTAQLVNLEADLNKKVATYSGGMKRRLSLAIALIQNPEILILDEPTVGIDPELRQQIWHELIRLKEQEGKTILVTTHVMDEAERCDFISMLRDGQIIAHGSPEDLKRDFQAKSLDEVFLLAGRETR